MTANDPPDTNPDPEKQSRCQRLCQSRLCLPSVFLAMAIGVAVMVPVVLLSHSVRDRFPPDQPWWQKGVVYQVYPRSFQDSDSDGVGDLRGITSRLDHLNYLNVKAVWISPFYPSPMRDFGYDVSNYTDVDPLFGTLDDFDHLLKKAHEKGLKIIIDFVAGHTSSDHEWFQNSVNRTPPYEDYYIWANGTRLLNGTRQPPSNWMSAFGHSAWQWSDARQQYYYHAFLPEQPTLNYRNPRVVQDMKNVLRFWLDRGVDGIRVDAVTRIMVYEDYYQDQAYSGTPGTEWWEPSHYVQNLTDDRPEIREIVKGWREVLDSYDDSDNDNDNYKFMVVELYANPEASRKYYDYGADIPFNFDLIFSLDNKLHVLNANYCDAVCIRDVIQAEYDAVPKGKWANFVLSNHDNHRAASRMGQQYVDALNLLLLTLRGTPTTYYGDEIGMEDIFVSYNDTQDPAGINYGPDRYQEVSRDPERSPMQWDSTLNAGFSNHTPTWLPLNPDYPTRNVQDQRNSTNVTNIQVYRELSTLRDEPAFRYGFFEFADVTPSILSYLRSAVGYPKFLVAINFGNTTVSHDFSGPPVNVGQGKVRLVTSEAANEGHFAKGKTVALTSVSLAPGCGIVLELQ
ncbi:alpha-glucosidase-like [Babylonia areolata]|uniref:alpha-glucosidase-like n=1 Tax=Babylonia areolata TaxID=304850 RepID=UPI003FD3F8B2